jgi:hypothetical protein
MISDLACRDLPSRVWIKISESRKEKFNRLAKITPTVLLPTAGIPMSMTFLLGGMLLKNYQNNEINTSYGINQK